MEENKSAGVFYECTISPGKQYMTIMTPYASRQKREKQERGLFFYGTAKIGIRRRITSGNYYTPKDLKGKWLRRILKRNRGRFGETIEYIAQDGRGIVFDANGNFLFFREGGL
jgi:hypothetical protein